MIKRMLGFVVISLAITAAIALGLILSQGLAEMDGEGGLDFANTLAQEGDEAQPLTSLPMRDGYEVQLRRYAAQIEGADDDAFFADKYEPVMSEANSNGSYLIVEGVNHLDIVNAPEMAAAINGFLRDE